jgi:hypothetical protein
MMRINEAYMAVLADVSAEEGHPERAHTPRAAGPGDPPTEHRANGAPPRDVSNDELFFRRWEQKAERGPTSQATDVGQLRDPAYAYYKAGFTYFNRGATALYRKEGKQLRRFLMGGGSFDAYVLRLVVQALHYFERSYSYFLVVVEKYPGSPWFADAKWKLHRLERFNSIYQRICENLARQSSSRRSSFSIVSGADPS